ncbi:DNA starvation/stationary phase protection protein [Labrenzia sp. 011]|uniref:Dps family protein n=1 Tax=Labrenzia sp. 011 TaxID=2171494 RepID=UPI000D508713|nr:DNA starvation/stationary phase protection protein [Labrenzia sp. 011]PVB60952.1 DNA starvation/stationary phase protection protein [Labrenzia sp. 011]
MTDTSQDHTGSLSKVLASTFRLYVQTHGYHWNVEGPSFRQLHLMFEEQYQNLWNALDSIAERIRSLGAYAPGSVAELMKLAGEEAAPAQSAEAMVDALIKSHDALAGQLRAAIVTAQEAGDEPSAGMLSDRLEWHEQQLWMMKASRK